MMMRPGPQIQIFILYYIMQGYLHVPINIHRARVTHDNNIQDGETYYVCSMHHDLSCIHGTRLKTVWGRYTSLSLTVPNTGNYIITPRCACMQIYLLCAHIRIRHTRGSLPTSRVAWLWYKICIPVIWYLSLIYLVYLIIPMPCISSCIANTISLEWVNSYQYSVYYFPGILHHGKKTRAKIIRVKVRWILFGIS